MASERRIQRIEQVLREECAGILEREIELPQAQGAMATITRAVVSSDARYATVYVSVLGAGAGETLEILAKNVYNIQQLLNRRLRMRPVPQIRFALDEEEMQRERIEKSLTELKNKNQL